MMEWLLRRRFLALLIAIGLLLVVNPLVQSFFGGRLLFDALIILVFLAAIQVVFAHNRLRLLALAFGIPILVGVWTSYLDVGPARLPLACGFHLAAVLLLGWTVVAILRAVHQDETVSADSVYGACCCYLMLGLIVGHVFFILDWEKGIQGPVANPLTAGAPAESLSGL
jgi:hypothetical protein